MANAAGRGERSASQQASSSSSSSPPRLPLLPVRSRSRSPDPLLIICGFFSFLTAAASLLCVAVNVISAIQSFKNGNNIFDGIFRCYAIVLALFVAVAETEWSFIMKFWMVLQYWAGRGMLQIFVAVMTRAFPDLSGKRKDLVLFQQLSSYILLACGLTYVISGLLCIGVLKRAREKNEFSADQVAKDLEELERRREELESLLRAANP
ncbi:vacuole protein [Wolffia australiana]